MSTCDFCSAADPPFLEPCADFDAQPWRPSLLAPIPGPVGRSTGPWASCPPCHELVTRGDWLALEERGAAAMQPKHPTWSRRELRLSVQAIQRQFRRHRIYAP